MSRLHQAGGRAVIALGRTHLARVLPYFVAWRAALQALAHLAAGFREPAGGAHPWADLPRWLDRWFQFDSGWFARIALTGYSPEPVPGAGAASVAFFPLYPVGMRVAGAALGLHPVVAGFVLSHVAALVALCVLWEIGELELGRGGGARIVRTVLVFPSSFFLVTVYAEAVLLASMAGSYAAARKGRWLLAAACAALATAAKPLGFATLPMLAAAFLAREGLRGWRRAWPLALAPAGAAAYSVYLWLAWGDPLLWLEAEAAWARGTGSWFGASLAGELEMLRALLPGTAGRIAVYPIDVAALVLTAAAGLALIARRRWALGALTAAVAAIPAYSGIVGAMSRFALVGVGTFVVVAHAGRRAPVARFAYGLVAPAVLAYGVFSFTTGSWFA